MDRYKIPFLNACIKAFGKRFDMSRSSAYDFLHRHNAMQFLLDFYDVEHLQSIDDTVDDLVIVCQRHGGSL